jgi:glycosyltransferase involved in cell wall biosynthesis
VREWITDGVNGLLCESNNTGALARALVRALDDERMLEEARERNRQMIAEHAEYNSVMKRAEEFYLKLISIP